VPAAVTTRRQEDLFRSVTLSAARDRESSLRSLLSVLRDSSDGSVRKLALCGRTIVVTLVFVFIYCLLFALVYSSLHVPQTLRFSFYGKIILELSEIFSPPFLILFLLFLPNYRYYYYCRSNSTLVSVRFMMVIINHFFVLCLFNLMTSYKTLLFCWKRLCIRLIERIAALLICVQ